MSQEQRDATHGEDLNKDVSSLPIAGRKKHLHEDMDALRWTREFMENNPNAFRAEIDEGTMLGWFSNAIMCGFDEANRRASARSETACIRISRSLAERTEAMFRSVDPQGFIALEWAKALNGGVSPADAGAPLPGSTPGASATSARRQSEAEIKAELHWAAWHTTEMSADEVLCLIANEFQWKLPR